MTINRYRFFAGRALPYLIALGILVGLWVVSTFNYTLFHTFAECFSIAVGWGIFFIVWNTGRKIENSALVFIGIAYFFVGTIDLLHTIAYDGMGVFPDRGADLPTQLWIAARYMQIGSLAVAPWLPDLRPRWTLIFAGFFIVSTLLVVSIFGGFFPVCFVPGSGLTTFKKVSEYFLCSLLFVSATGFQRRKEEFDPDFRRWLLLSLAATFLSELSFTLYASVYGSFNMAGHLFKVLATWFMYRAVIEVGLNRPLDLLFLDHKRNLESLNESEARYRQLAECSLTGIFIHQDGLAVYVNSRMAEMLACTPDDLAGKPFLDTIYQEDRDAAAGMSMARLRGEASPAVSQLRFVKKNGDVMWAEVLETLIEYRGQPAIMGNVGDVTNRKEAEEALRESERLYRNLFEQARKQEELYLSFLNCSADPIVVYDMEGRVQFLNPAHTRLFGWTLEEVRGKHLNTLPEEDRAQTCRIISDIVNQGDVHQSYDTQRITKNGRLVDVSVSGARYLDHQGNPAGMLVIIRDITQRKRDEETLRESEQRFRTLLEVSPAGFWATDAAGSNTYVSPHWSAITGIPGEDARGDGWALGLHPEDRNAVIESWKRATVIKEPYASEFRFTHPGGHCVWVLCRALGVMGDDGNPAEWLGTLTDITELKEAEKALKESERRLWTLTANLPGIAYRCSNDEDWPMEFISEGCLALTGYLPRELVGNGTVSFADLIHPQDRERVWHQVQEAVALEKPFELEYRLRTRSGEVKWVWERGTSVSVDGTDEIQLEGFISDITERKQIEQALQESEQRYRAVIENIQVGISVINPDMEIVATNRFFRKLYPCVRPGLGQICYETCNEPPRLSPCLDCPCLRTFEDGMVHENLVETPTAEGTRNHRVVSCPIKDAQGKVELIIELVEDITERRALQLQLARAQKMEAVGTLAGGVAHDFNNLLQVVLGYSELMLDDEGFPEQYREDLARVCKAARSGADLVKRLLTFSRESGYEPRRVNLNRRMEQLQKMLSRTIPRMIDIRLELAPKVASINADPIQIDQVLMNLSVNAWEAMPDGGRLIMRTENVILGEQYCRTYVEATAGPHVLVSVSDTGKGMDEKTLEHIFEPFFTTKGPTGGTGLGLAMVYGIVKQHGGHIRCNSQPGTGTVFQIYLPSLDSERERQETAVTAISPGGTETIFLVDDDEFVRELGTRILKKSGYTVITAANGLEALGLYEQRRSEIDLVILDLIMPEMGGKQCLQELLKLNPSITVIVASGHSPDGTTKEMLSFGASGFINKPYKINQVLQAVRDVLDAKQG